MSPPPPPRQSHFVEAKYFFKIIVVYKAATKNNLFTMCPPQNVVFENATDTKRLRHVIGYTINKYRYFDIWLSAHRTVM
jgi:hypothetical protein